jgi:hypothetical protein
MLEINIQRAQLTGKKKCPNCTASSYSSFAMPNKPVAPARALQLVHFNTSRQKDDFNLSKTGTSPSVNIWRDGQRMSNQ